MIKLRFLIPGLIPVPLHPIIPLLCLLIFQPTTLLHILLAPERSARYCALWTYMNHLIRTIFYQSFLKSVRLSWPLFYIVFCITLATFLPFKPGRNVLKSPLFSKSPTSLIQTAVVRFIQHLLFLGFSKPLYPPDCDGFSNAIDYPITSNMGSDNAVLRVIYWSSFPTPSRPYSMTTEKRT